MFRNLGCRAGADGRDLRRNEGAVMEYQNFQRIWEPLNTYVDVAYLNTRTRVIRWYDRTLPVKSKRWYQVQIHNGDRWMPVSQEFPHAAAAWRRAKRYVNAQMRVRTA